MSHEIYGQNPDGSWSTAEPMGWQEEHNRMVRLIFWLRGIEHCNDREGQHIKWAEKIARRGH